jgi:S-(hydroxymethyl)glutathione dehydrogenase/alcohol dehydrogenase
MKAAVRNEFKKALVVQEVEIDSPGKGEVKVRYAATAICHSDINFIEGEFLQDLPVIAGHESAGYVEEVGETVTSAKPGDNVIVSSVVSCGKCKPCNLGLSHLCEIRNKLDIDGHLRNRKGKGIFTNSMVAGFAEQSIVLESQLTKVPKYFPLDFAALLACGVITGFGSVVNRAKVQPLSSVVVIGTGGVGLNAIQGAAVLLWILWIINWKPPKSSELPILVMPRRRMLSRRLRILPMVGELTTSLPQWVRILPFVKQSLCWGNAVWQLL